MKIKIRTNNKNNILLEGFNSEPEPNEEEQILKSRLTDKDIEKPGVKELLQLNYIPVVRSVKKGTTEYKHSISLGQGAWRRSI